MGNQKSTYCCFYKTSTFGDRLVWLYKFGSELLTKIYWLNLFQKKKNNNNNNIKSYDYMWQNITIDEQIFYILLYTVFFIYVNWTIVSIAVDSIAIEWGSRSTKVAFQGSLLKKDDFHIDFLTIS